MANFTSSAPPGSGIVFFSSTGLRSYTHAVALVLIETESSCDEGCVLGSARGLTSSDALICCQVLVLILMADETDPARGLIRS